MTALVLWRISNFKDLTGIGGTIVSGRWHTKGRPVVYLADSPATCVLEVLVHFEMAMGELQESFTLLRVELPDSVSVKDAREQLKPGWHEQSEVTQAMKDGWLASSESLLLRVPTAIVPENCNFIFNPLHPEARQAKLTSFEFPADKRLFTKLS